MSPIPSYDDGKRRRFCVQRPKRAEVFISFHSRHDSISNLSVMQVYGKIKETIRLASLVLEVGRQRAQDNST